MRFQVNRESLLRPLQRVIGVVEKKQTMPILGNVLIVCDGNTVRFSASDMEVEMQAVMAAPSSEAGEITVSARKFFDIIRALADGQALDIQVKGEKLQIAAGKNRYTLATLPGRDFPLSEIQSAQYELKIDRDKLKAVLECTSFAMAAQDVRYYLNGLLFEVRDGALRTVATDGHRLAIADTEEKLSEATEIRQWIVPRKGVAELQRILDGEDAEVVLVFSSNHLRVEIGDTIFSSKLIDGRYPDYEAVVPIAADKTALIGRETLRASLQRAAILSNEKYRGVRLELQPNLLRIVAHNPEQEQAEEELVVETTVSGVSVGFNVNYLLESLNAVGGVDVLLCLRDGGSSGLLKRPDSDKVRQVVMPLRL